jgi:hypothetical protein
MTEAATTKDALVARLVAAKLAAAATEGQVKICF